VSESNESQWNEFNPNESLRILVWSEANQKATVVNAAERHLLKRMKASHWMKLTDIEWLPVEDFHLYPNQLHPQFLVRTESDYVSAMKYSPEPDFSKITHWAYLPNLPKATQ